MYSSKFRKRVLHVIIPVESRDCEPLMGDPAKLQFWHEN